MKEKPKRIKLSSPQVAFMREVLAASAPAVRAAGERIAAGEVVPDSEAEAAVAVLADAMLDDEAFDGEALTARGVRIDDIIGIVQQMSQRFYE